ncbi:hypothetical protein Trisim1_007461 [Trichoderma cf. simile WF8]
MAIQLFKNSRGKSMVNFDKTSCKTPAKWITKTLPPFARDARSTYRHSKRTQMTQTCDLRRHKSQVGFQGSLPPLPSPTSNLQLEINPRLNISKASSKDDDMTAYASDVALALGMDPDAANDPLALYETIHKRLLNNLELFAPHTNPSKLRNSGLQTMCEISVDAMGDIITHLRNRVNILYDEYLD